MSGSRAASAPLAGSADPLGGAPLVLRWRQGTSQQYAVRMDSSFRMNTTGAGAAQAGQSIAVQLDGILEFRTLEVEPSQALVGMQLSSVALRVSGVSDAATNQGSACRFGFGSLRAACPPPSSSLPGCHRSIAASSKTWCGPSRWWCAAGRTGRRKNRISPESTRPPMRHRPIAPAEDQAALRGAGDGAHRPSRDRFQGVLRIDAERDWIAAMTVDEMIRSDDSTGLP